jgi:hypothetical protein
MSKKLFLIKIEGVNHPIIVRDLFFAPPHQMLGMIEIHDQSGDPAQVDWVSGTIDRSFNAAHNRDERQTSEVDAAYNRGRLDERVRITSRIQRTLLGE